MLICMQITKAIVLRTIRYTDSRLIVSLYTEHYGMVSAMVRISRSSKGRTNSALWQLLNVLEISIGYRADVEIQKIGECSISRIWADLPYNPKKASVAMFLAEMLFHSLRGEGENQDLFRFLEKSLCWFDETTEGVSYFHLFLMIRMTRFLGIMPGTDGAGEGMVYDLKNGCYCHSVPEHGQYIESKEAELIPVLLDMDYSNMHLLALSNNERRHMLDILLKYYRIHVPAFGKLRSLDVLRELFS